MTEIKTKAPSTTWYLRQVQMIEKRSAALYAGNNSILMRELLDSKEVSAFFARKWREARKKFKEES